MKAYMNGINIMQTQELTAKLVDLIEESIALSRLIKNYQESKDIIDGLIAVELNHGEIGQKTYTVSTELDEYKVVINSAHTYTLDKKAYIAKYEHIAAMVSDKYNPICEKTTLTINNAVMKDALKHASAKELLALSAVITESLAKTSVRIKKTEEK